MNKFLVGVIMLFSTTAIAADNILITDVAIKTGDQVIVFVDDIGRYVTVATEDAINVVFEAEDVMPGKHEALVRVVNGKLRTVKETQKTITVE